MSKKREVKEKSKEFLLITSFYYKRAKAAHKQTQKRIPLPYPVTCKRATNSRKGIKKVVKISKNGLRATTV